MQRLVDQREALNASSEAELQRQLAEKTTGLHLREAAADQVRRLLSTHEVCMSK